jgi:hypothetical protein
MIYLHTEFHRGSFFITFNTSSYPIVVHLCKNYVYNSCIFFKDGWNHASGGSSVTPTPEIASIIYGKILKDAKIG